MRKIICDICGNEIKIFHKYQFELYPSDESRYNSKRAEHFYDVCDYCANDLFNYIDTMEKTMRVKLST